MFGATAHDTRACDQPDERLQRDTVDYRRTRSAPAFAWQEHCSRPPGDYRNARDLEHSVRVEARSRVCLEAIAPRGRTDGRE
jgi:hypothetical protein